MTAELEGKRVLVLGLGLSGCSAANYCAARGADVVAVDERPEEGLRLPSEIAPSVEVRVGEPFPDPADFDLVVPSPGVPPQRYASRAKRVWGDIELAARALPMPIVAVTGTNGKSTTVSLIEALLREAGLRARAAGNLGTPALELVSEGLDVAVLEVSSFQLESVESFAPRVAVILNVTPDHLDRHGSLEAYADAKARILDQQRSSDVAVLNFDDPVVRALAPRVRGRLVAFGSGRLSAPAKADAVWLDGSSAVLRREEETRRVSLEGLRLVGRHNLENAVAAIAAVWALGIDPQDGIAALAGFGGLPHRCEVVAEARGVTWLNDSKATNVGAAVRSLEGLRGPLVWIAGGSDKKLDFAPLADAARGRVRAALLIGETAAALESVLAHVVPCERVGDLETAVARAAALAETGDVVLLCPACASFDQFANFAERGDRFRAAARSAAAGTGTGTGGAR